MRASNSCKYVLERSLHNARIAVIALHPAGIRSATFLLSLYICLNDWGCAWLLRQSCSAGW